MKTRQHSTPIKFVFVFQVFDKTISNNGFISNLSTQFSYDKGKFVRIISKNKDFSSPFSCRKEYEKKKKSRKKQRPLM